MRLRIASYNIHKGVSAFGRKTRIHDLKESIKTLDADLIFLQEVQGQHDLHARRHAHWPDQGQHEFIAGDSHCCVYGLNASYDHGHHGNALLSRFPIVQSHNHDISDHAYEQRGILHARVQWSHCELHCFVLHLGLFAASRRRQIQSLVQHIKTQVPEGHPLIIAGDFNDWTQRLSLTLYEELGVVEAFDEQPENHGAHSVLHSLRALFHHRSRHARTFPAPLPWLSLDRVYSRGFQIKQAQVMTGKPWSELSDHVPIFVDLELESSYHAHMQSLAQRHA